MRGGGLGHDGTCNFLCQSSSFNDTDDIVRPATKKIRLLIRRVNAPNINFVIILTVVSWPSSTCSITNFRETHTYLTEDVVVTAAVMAILVSVSRDPVDDFLVLAPLTLLFSITVGVLRSGCTATESTENNGGRSQV